MSFSAPQDSRADAVLRPYAYPQLEAAVVYCLREAGGACEGVKRQLRMRRGGGKHGEDPEERRQGAPDETPVRPLEAAQPLLSQFRACLPIHEDVWKHILTVAPSGHTRSGKPHYELWLSSTQARGLARICMEHGAGSCG